MFGYYEHVPPIWNRNTKIDQKNIDNDSAQPEIFHDVKADPYVSDVSVKYKTLVLDAAESEITKGTYDPGIHTIQLTSPAANMSASAGRIVKQMPYYVVLEIAGNARAEVTITGHKYVGTELATLSRIEHIKSGEVRNTKTFSGTLLNYESANKVADNILDYYQLQQIIQTRHLSAEEKQGTGRRLKIP